MATIISVGIQKGGAGKTTTASMLAYLLSQKHKVLAIDMDGQGNLTQVLSGVEDLYEFEGKTIYDALLNEDATEYIIKLTDNLHMLAGDENINTLGSHFYITLPRQHKKTYPLILQRTLESVKNQYDYIIIDNPPALGELSIVSLSASDYVVIMFEPKKFSYSSLKRYFKTIEAVQGNINHNLKILGILRTLIDNRRSDYKYFSDLVEEEFKDLCFKTVIQRTATIGRMDSLGIIGNPEIKQIIKHYEPFLKELMTRVKGISR